MAGDFSVMASHPDDLGGIIHFLDSHAASPPDAAWPQIHECIIDLQPEDEPQRRFPRNGSYIVVDRNGAIRAFCMTRWLHHPVHRDMLDLPVIVMEDGPNRNEIARTLFDHLVKMARAAACDAVRFPSPAPDVWRRWLDVDRIGQPETGMIMPLSVAQPHAVASAPRAEMRTSHLPCG